MHDWDVDCVERHSDLSPEIRQDYQGDDLEQKDVDGQLATYAPRRRKRH